jgi:hypothetical protein
VFPNTHNFASLWLAANKRESLMLFLPTAVIFCRLYDVLPKG